MIDVIWTIQAINDILETALYISQDSTESSDRFIEEIFKTERLFLASVNFEGRKYTGKRKHQYDYHYFIEGNYKIIYYRKSLTVYIATVFDTRQDPDKLNL